MGTEVHHELKDCQKLDGLTKALDEQRRVKQLVDIPHGIPRSLIDTNVNDLPTMDNVPLKDPFPNMKVRKRQLQERKSGSLGTSGSPSPRNQETDDLTRSRLRESLSAALRAASDSDVNMNSVRSQDLITGMQVYKTMIKEIGQKAFATGCVITGGLEGVEDSEGLSMDRQNFDVKGESTRYEFLHMCEVETNKNVGATAGQTCVDEAPFKKTRLNVEENAKVNGTEVSRVMPLAENVAFSIEAELFRLFGGVNRKYKEKAQSLLFNLKDQSNPELRARVCSGEITPANLCSMSTEHLAARELSQWRIAKAEELAHMVLLTDADANIRRLVKKSHKGEFEVQAEKDHVPEEVATGGVRQGCTFEMKIETHHDSERTQKVVHLDQMDIDSQEEAECPELSPLGRSVALGNISGGRLENSVGENGIGVSEGQEKLSDLDSGRPEDLEGSLPTIMSLDEYFSCRKNVGVEAATAQEVKASINIPNTKRTALSVSNELHVPSPSKSNKKNEHMEGISIQNLSGIGIGSRKLVDVLHIKEKMHNKKEQKLWEGSFQLSGSLISPVLAFFRSGERMDLQSWSNIVEVKGRVRLDALDKFLQELHLSRTRSVMIISCRIHRPEENAVSVSALKEVSNRYEKGERVGYAEPAVGFELYMFPPGGSSLKLLSDHGYFDTTSNEVEHEDSLVGCIVWRRTPSSSAVPKASSHYYCANRHALLGQLDSPTHPNEAQQIDCVPESLKTSSVPLPNASSGLQPKLQYKAQQTVTLTNEQNRVTVANLNMENANNYISGTPFKNLTQRPQGLDEIDDSQVMEHPQDTQMGRILVKPSESIQDQSREEDIKDIPPGFGPMPLTMPKTDKNISTLWDDDDLPEFDFSSETQHETLKASATNTPSQRRLQGLSYQQVTPFPQLPLAQRGLLPSFSLPQKLGSLECGNIGFHHISLRSQFPHMVAIPEQVNTLQEPHTFSNLQMPQEKFMQDPPVVNVPQLSRFPAVSHAAQPLHSIPHILADGLFLERPSHAVTVPSLPSVLHTERKNSLFPIVNLHSQCQLGLLGARPRPVNHFTVCEPKKCPSTSDMISSQGANQSCEVRRRKTWDDDDMPEWYPPPMTPRETSLPPLLPSPPIIAQSNGGSRSLIPARPLQFGQQILPLSSLSETKRADGRSPGFRSVRRL